MRTRLFAAVSILLALGLVPWSTSAQRNPEALIPDQPGHWVGFSADMDLTPPPEVSRQAPRIIGRMYRDHNGSERMETGPEQQPIEGLTLTVVSIKNIPVERYYRYSPQTGWISQPMKLPPGRWEPKPLWATLDESRRMQRVEGFDVYPMGPPSNTRLVAPALNGAVIAQQSTHDGFRRLLYNIRVEPQSAALFEPPPGADVLISSEFGGIVSSGPNEPHPTMNGPSDIHDLIMKRMEDFQRKYPQAKNLRPPPRN